MPVRAERPSRLLSIHSFTATVDGKQRPWAVGFSNRQDMHYADDLIRTLRDSVAGLVGDNQPYAFEDDYEYSLPMHG